MEVNIPVEIPDQRLADLLTTAFEGGSNYWCCLHNEDQNEEYEALMAEYRIGGPKNPSGYPDDVVTGSPYALIAMNNSLVLTEKDEGHLPNGNEKHTLNREKLEAGLKLMAEKSPKHFQDFINENEDAITADCFLQMALLQEHRYG